MPLLVVRRCLSRLMRHCFLGSVNLSTSFRVLLFSVEISPVWLTKAHIFRRVCMTWRLMPTVAHCRLCSRVSAWVGAFARSAISSALSASVHKTCTTLFRSCMHSLKEEFSEYDNIYSYKIRYFFCCLQIFRFQFHFCLNLLTIIKRISFSFSFSFFFFSKMIYLKSKWNMKKQ